jgi:dual specificity MAP kinase phosphatase
MKIHSTGLPEVNDALKNVFCLNTENFKSVRITNEIEILEISARDLCEIWDKFTKSHHFVISSMSKSLHKDMRYHTGILMAKYEDEQNGRCGIYLPASADFFEIFAENNLVQMPPLSQRNWKNQIWKFSLFSNLIIYCDGGFDTGNLPSMMIEKIKNFASLWKKFHKSKSVLEHRIMIMTDSLDEVRKLYPHMIVDGTYSSFKELERLELNSIGNQTESFRNIFVGNALNFKNNSADKTSPSFDFFVYVGRDADEMNFNGNLTLMDVHEELVQMENNPIEYCVEYLESWINEKSRNNQNTICIFLQARPDVKFCNHLVIIGSLILKLSKIDKLISINCSNGYSLSYGLLIVIEVLENAHLLNDIGHKEVLRKSVFELYKRRPFFLFNPIFVETLSKVLFMFILKKDFCSTYIENPIELPKLPSKILPFLYLGCLSSAKNIAMLNEIKITRVLSIGPKPNRTLDDNLHIWGVEDDSLTSLLPYFAQCIEYIDLAAIEESAVLVHCAAGISRSATIVIAYIMYSMRLGLKEAFTYVRSRRLNVVVQPNEQFMYDLLEFEMILFGSKRISWIDLSKEMLLINKNYSSLNV